MDTIYIAFTDSDSWFKHFLKPGFGHCLVLLPFTEEWLEVDPSSTVLQFHKRTHSQITHYTKILKVKLNGYNFKGIPLKFLSCVTMVEYMLGRNINAITPYRLYKKLTGSLKETFNTKEIKS
jgi:hypothetical protein